MATPPNVHQSYQGMPTLATPLINPDSSVSIPWYKFFLSLLQRIGALTSQGSGQTAVILVQDPNGNLDAIDPVTGTTLGQVTLGPSPVGGPPQPQALSSSPFIFTATGAGMLLTSGGEVEVRRGAGTWYTLGVMGGSPWLLAGDSARITWFTADAPSATFFPVG